MRLFAATCIEFEEAHEFWCGGGMGIQDWGAAIGQIIPRIWMPGNKPNLHPFRPLIDTGFLTIMPERGGHFQAFRRPTPAWALG